MGFFFIFFISRNCPHAEALWSGQAEGSRKTCEMVSEPVVVGGVGAQGCPIVVQRWWDPLEKNNWGILHCAINCEGGLPGR